MVLTHITGGTQPALHSCKECSSCHDNAESGGREKKRRLTVEQVNWLETSFEREKKLQRQMKIQLAIELGLKPRQVAVWYQNRRVRGKAKQLEQDYFILKERYERVLLEKQKLEAEVIRLTLKLRMAERRTKEENITSGCGYATEEKTLEQRSSCICSGGPAKRCKVFAGQCSEDEQAVAEPEQEIQQLQCHILQNPIYSEDAGHGERDNHQQIATKSGDIDDNMVSQHFCNSDLVSLDGEQGMTTNCLDYFNV